ncbi:MAG: ribosome small subunit-dependent GTPase A [Oscillospiraceae bacterium]|jgi:ribosome biogenesis GTPase|nr:ribosome small subunit-dependent GTPase A [Oscillospiraceae bacterium]
MLRGVIFKALSGFYYVETDGGTLECRARGRLRLDGAPPLVGDAVSVSATEPGKGVVVDILPRRNAFTRPPVANIDQLVIVVSGAAPATDPFLVDRMTAAAHSRDCRAVICVNKCDVDDADTLFDIYSRAGFITIRTSADSGLGRDETLAVLSGRFSAFTGNSGVGKSSIINMLTPGLDIATGDISRRLGRGRHTTRHVELYRLNDGAVIADTPGFSAFDADSVGMMKKTELQRVFPDFAPYIGKCRFDDCLHISEPGCAVRDAVASGAIHPSRHSGYERLCREAAEREARMYK